MIVYHDALYLGGDDPMSDIDERSPTYPVISLITGADVDLPTDCALDSRWVKPAARIPGVNRGRLVPILLPNPVLVHIGAARVSLT